MNKPKKFYVAMYSDDHGFGFSVNSKNNFPEIMPEDAASIADVKKKFRIDGKDNNSDMAESFVEFTESMIGYIDFLPFVASIANTFSSEMGKRTLVEFLDKNAEAVEEKEKSKIYIIPADKIRDLNKIRDDLKAGYLIGAQVPRMLLIGFVSSYEHYMAILAKIILTLNPGIISERDKFITVKEAIEASSIDEIKERILDKELDNVFRGGFEAQVKWFERAISTSDIESSFKRWSDLVEVFERRNIFTHNNGLVNQHYLTSAIRLKFPGAERLSLGDQLEANPRYFIDSLRLIIEFGVQLIQISWRKTVKDEEELADQMLSDFGFELIVRGQYKLAARVLEFALSLRGNRRESRKRVILINLANAFALQGGWDKSKEVLDQEDWSAVGPEFNCCLSALRKDVDGVLNSMRALGKNGDISLSDYQEWPVFFHVREEAAFREEFERIFKRPYTPSPKKRGGITRAFRRLQLEVNSDVRSSESSVAAPATRH